MSWAQSSCWVLLNLFFIKGCVPLDEHCCEVESLRWFLVAASVKEAAFKRYAKEVSFFVIYNVNRGLDIASVEDLDVVFQEYMEEVEGLRGFLGGGLCKGENL